MKSNKLENGAADPQPERKHFVEKVLDIGEQSVQFNSEIHDKAMFDIASKTIRMRYQPLWNRILWAIKGFV